jgi:hypothetical protein
MGNLLSAVYYSKILIFYEDAMKLSCALTCVIAVSMLTACTASPIPAEPPVQRERIAYLKQAASIPVTCTAGADCTLKWERAHQWVAIHSVYGIKTDTDSELTTNGPVDPATDSAFTIKKTPQDSNTVSITFASSCGKTPVCSPSALELKAGFNHFVMYGNSL